MKTIPKLGVLAVFAALALPGFGQLSVSYVPTSGVASAMQAGTGTLLTYAEFSQPGFTAAGLEFSMVPNYALGDIVVGTGEEGTFFANVSFLGRESMPVNHFGVSDAGLDGYTAGGITLFNAYNVNLPYGTTAQITAAAYTEANFWHYRDSAGYTGTFFMDEVLSFRTWEAVDVDANRIYTFVGIDDLRSQAIDFNDGLFLIERNLLPIGADTPVPEPSTYGMLGALALLGLVAYRRSRLSAGVVSCGYQKPVVLG